MIVEIRQAEGGEDAKDLVNKLFNIYKKYMYKECLDYCILKENPGFISFEVNGEKSKIFKKEAGGHRWQRVPPTEKRGRVHTSSVTVAVLSNEEDIVIDLDSKDIRMRTYKASGKGGQHRNKVESAVELTHVPTGITSQSEEERNQQRNRKIALDRLEEKLYNYYSSASKDKRSKIRKDQVGTGLRGDKIITIQEQNGIAVNHVNKKKINIKEYLKGDLRKLW
jgi:peptide chain release factor 1